MARITVSLPGTWPKNVPVITSHFTDIRPTQFINLPREARYMQQIAVNFRLDFDCYNKCDNVPMIHSP